MTAPEQAVQAKAIELGKLAVRATTAAGSGHPTPPSPFSPTSDGTTMHVRVLARASSSILPIGLPCPESACVCVVY